MIVGVVPASFNDWRHLGAIDVFRPLSLDPQQTADRNSTILRLIGRRSAKLPVAESDAFIAHFGAPGERLSHVNAGSSWRAVRLNETVYGKDGPVTLAMCVGLSAFVLLIACSNLANLFLARTVARAREFAVRSALGATRGQILRPLIAESLVLALAGCACAFIVAHWAADWLAV